MSRWLGGLWLRAVDLQLIDGNCLHFVGRGTQVLSRRGTRVLSRGEERQTYVVAFLQGFLGSGT